MYASPLVAGYSPVSIEIAVVFPAPLCLVYYPYT